MRRWVPGPAKSVAAPAALNLADVLACDLTFCSEFAVHGGLAASDQGFKAEAELTRMQQAGLLVLQRDPAPPFAILRVALSPAMRELLVSARPRAATAPSSQAIANFPTQSASDQGMRRNGFEVARGMIGAAVKAEFSILPEPMGENRTASLERRVMNRITALQTPFEA